MDKYIVIYKYKYLNRMKVWGHGTVGNNLMLWRLNAHKNSNEVMDMRKVRDLVRTYG